MGSFFLPGHVIIAEAAVVLAKCGGIPVFLAQHECTLDNKDPCQELLAWQQSTQQPAKRSHSTPPS
jgi:hypothetical protein